MYIEEGGLTIHKNHQLCGIIFVSLAGMEGKIRSKNRVIFQCLLLRIYVRVQSLVKVYLRLLHLPESSKDQNPLPCWDNFLQKEKLRLLDPKYPTLGTRILIVKQVWPANEQVLTMPKIIFLEMHHILSHLR